MRTTLRHAAIAAGLCLTAATAEAAGFSFMSDLFVPPPPADKSCTCADLGGVWSGTCGTAPVQLRIEQRGCHNIVVNGDQLSVGGLKTQSVSLAPDLCVGAKGAYAGYLSATGESTADWNRDMTVLTVAASQTSRVIGGAATPARFEGTLRLDGAHLLVDAKKIDSEGATTGVSCSFEK